VEAPGKGPLLPELADALARAPGDIVSFELGTGVRMVDFVRAVECGRGTSFVPLMSVDADVGPLILEPPEPWSGDESLLLEDPAGSDRVLVSVCLLRRTANETISGPWFSFEGELYRDARRLPLPPAAPAGLLIRAHDGAPWWSRCAPLVERTRKAGWRLWFGFAKRDPQFFGETMLDVPVAEDGDAALDVLLPEVREVGPEVRGRAARLRVPPDSRAGEVFRATLHLLAGGASGVEFDAVR
jgi:hypothetical protein